ncbi:hypothetical protein ACOMHN_004733 [Nucella lapillus]
MKHATAHKELYSRCRCTGIDDAHRAVDRVLMFDTECSRDGDEMQPVLSQTLPDLPRLELSVIAKPAATQKHISPPSVVTKESILISLPAVYTDFAKSGEDMVSLTSEACPYRGRYGVLNLRGVSVQGKIWCP